MEERFQEFFRPDVNPTAFRPSTRSEPKVLARDSDLRDIEPARHALATPLEH
jgi:hypothetical protein